MFVLKINRGIVAACSRPLLRFSCAVALTGGWAIARAEDGAVDATDNVSNIIVTGMRGGQSRTLADSPVPIDVINAKELQATGRSGLKEILGNIVPSMTIATAIASGTAASVKPIAIRGLTADYLLVLVNGKRRHASALVNNASRVARGSTPVDIDLIPTGAIARIEVLRDGAAAQYGSDAIAGVINIILDDAPEGGQFSASGGEYFVKGGLLLQQSLSWGTSVGEDGFLRLSVDGRYQDRAKSSGEPVPYIFPFMNGQPDPREATVEHRVAEGYGQSSRNKVITGSLNGELPIGDDLRVYGFGTLSWRDIHDAKGVLFPSPTGYGGQPSVLPHAALPQIYPRGYLGFRDISEVDYQGTAGIKGALAGWQVDLSSSFGRDNARLVSSNTLNPSIGPTSKTKFFLGRQIQTLWVNNLDLSREYEVGLAAPLNIALGLEHRWERFQELAGEPDSYRSGGYIIPHDDTTFGLFYGGIAPSPGASPAQGTTPADAISLSRNTVAAYLDISTDISKKWFVGLAARFEHYDDSAGNTISGKFSTRYELLPGLAIRGGVNSGLRAPSLAQRGFGVTQFTNSYNGTVLATLVSKLLPVGTPAAIALGAQPLKPEKSMNFTGGITYESGSVRLTVDGYQIQIRDRITATEQLGTAANGGAAIRNILLANGITGANSAQFLTNAIDTRTRGIDTVGEYTLRSDLGTFRLSAAYSYTRTKITDVIPNPTELSSLNVTLFGRQARRDLEVLLPHSKLILTSDWSLDRIHALVRLTRFDRYTESSNVAAGDRVFGAKWITDLEVGYRLGKNVVLSAGANNLFDVYPDKNGLIDYAGAFGYGIVAPFGISGGFYYSRLSVGF